MSTPNLKLYDRFISTCVEKIRDLDRPFGRAAVHLHVRGENLQFYRAGFYNLGSSPRAWRKFEIRAWRNSPERFISTCVEKIMPGTPFDCSPAVHLHVRGENWAEYAFAVSGSGSSPRAWRKFSG